MATPTIAGAIARVREDEQARFAALLAAVFAFSFGFVFGFVMGSLESGQDEPTGRAG